MKEQGSQGVGIGKAKSSRRRCKDLRQRGLWGNRGQEGRHDQRQCFHMESWKSGIVLSNI